MQEEKSSIGHEKYGNILKFLFSDEDWCNQLSPDLLRALIGANCIKSDFGCYAKAISAMPPYKTTNYNCLLTAAVEALGAYLDRKDVPSAQFELIKNFVMTFMKPTTSEIFTLFLNLPHLKTNDEKNMFSDTKSVLAMLIIDIKVKSQDSKLFKELVSKRRDIPFLSLVCSPLSSI